MTTGPKNVPKYGRTKNDGQNANGANAPIRARGGAVVGVDPATAPEVTSK